MSRIQKGYEAQFRELLQRAGARRLEQGVNWWVGKARSLSAEKGISFSEALTATREQLAQKSRPGKQLGQVPLIFFCDAGLGGLARWLRAAGYEALWEAGIEDSVLLERARGVPATVLTTDSMLMERRLVRDRIVPTLWLPPTLTISEQLVIVFREFGLAVLQPRCMACGGELRAGDKEALRERIPPRTYLWLNEFFVCSRCDKLFWHGTHWHRIRAALRQVEARGSLPKSGAKRSRNRPDGEGEIEGEV